MYYVYLVVSGNGLHVFKLNALKQRKNAAEQAMHDMYFYEYKMHFDV